MADTGTLGPAYRIGGAFTGAPGKPSEEARLSFNQWIISWYGIISFLLLWQIAPLIGLTDRRFIPPLS